ncbi:hypothetical protein NIES4074_36400 [Cylindrospermum sp. NIES-4074]|nr:hypothetical protein NIES4074_36400 [Cylindrospermum sp. NIES-4074]
MPNTYADDNFSPVYDENGTHISDSGLTKREYFAAFALLGILASRKCPDKDAAAKAVTLADDLIAKLSSRRVYK